MARRIRKHRKADKRRVIAALLFMALAVGLYRTCERMPSRGRSVHGYAVPIPELQGAGHMSPWSGREVINVRGVVTAVLDNGFYMQDPSGDHDPSTSDAIFVFTATHPSAGVGDDVSVSGRVTEYSPGAKEAWNLTITELVRPHVKVLGSGRTLPAPVRIGAGGRQPPLKVIEDDAVNGSVEIEGVAFDPERDGLDFFESLEGMRVEVRDAVVVGPTSRFGEIVVLVDGGARSASRTSRGGVLAKRDDLHPERIVVDDTIISPPPNADVGDNIDRCVGVMHYSFGSFKIANTNIMTVKKGGLIRETTKLKSDAEHLTVVSYNVFNLHRDQTARLEAIARQIVTRLGAPDIVALQEIQDDSGRLDDGVVNGRATFTALTSAIRQLGGPEYRFEQIDPEDRQDGGPPGSNIRVGFLFRAERVVFQDRFGDLFRHVPELSGQMFGRAGRWRENASVFMSTRKPLVGEFRVDEQRFVVINVHLSSKRGNPPLFGRVQPPPDRTQSLRQKQMEELLTLISRLLRADSATSIIVLGDFNDFEYSPPLHNLTPVGGSPLRNLTLTLPENDRYTYLHLGNSQALDHILVTPALAASVEYDVVHMNAEFATSPSDHDAVVARFRLR
ncbi:MAG: endonuclease/exonuclease/phosphatase family protein [Planctomycetes bacterium]|nr:endonuclease/exonuclease/phosphatase family protein [Planctomycetota bacterium]